jgi:hypothetical protein
MSTDFDRQSYWRARFEHETAFEWLLSSPAFMSILEPHLTQSYSRVLHLGFGTSDLQNHLRTRCRRPSEVVNVDYEPLAAERGRDLERRAFGDVRMHYVVADVTDLQRDLERKGHVRGGTFDLVIDKSTADAVSCAGTEALLRMAGNIRSVLAPDGVWISLSYSATRFDLEGLPFDVEVLEKVLTPKLKSTEPDVYHHCYMLRPK